MNRKTRKKVLIIAAALIIIIAAYIITSLACISHFSELQLKSEAYQTAVLSKKTSVMNSPFDLAIPTEKAEQGTEINILACGKRWSKVLYSSGAQIKTGYIKNSCVSKAQNGVIIASMLDIEKSDFVCEAGENAEIPVKLYPAYSNEKIIWQSSDESIASVENGMITGVSPGTAVISAKINCETEEIKVTVVKYDTSFAFKSDEYTLNRGKSINLSKELDGDEKGIEWKSSDSSIISVDDGKITAKSGGTAIITALKDGAKASCRVYVRNANTNAKAPLDIVSAYGNIYNYHPSVQYFENGWNGYKYWCAFTPYEKCNDMYENPHILASNDLKTWVEPKGFSNPLEPMPPDYEHGQIYNSDTELVYNTDTGKLECWWRFFDRPHDNHVILRRKTTSDGVHWSEREDMIVADMSTYDFLSPAIIYENGIYKMWAINENTRYSLDYRESADGKNWSEIRHIDVKYDDNELYHWHLDVIHTAKGYEMAISAYYPKTRDRQHMDLYYTYSPDNITYTKAELLFSPSRNTSKWDNQGLYRSSLLYADGKYYLFYSGLDTKRGPSGLGLVSGTNPFNMK